MVTLNRAIAAAMVDGPEAGLALLEPLRDSLGDHHRLLAARAHLLEMSGSDAAAAEEYAAAARLHQQPARAALPADPRRPAGRGPRRNFVNGVDLVSARSS